MKKKKLVICASASFEKEIIYWKNKLKQQGFKVIKYPQAIKENLLKNYQKEFSEHYRAIARADVLFILNLEKKRNFWLYWAGSICRNCFCARNKQSA